MMINMLMLTRGCGLAGYAVLQDGEYRIRNETLKSVVDGS